MKAGTITRIAYAEDAMAIASWAEAQGFPEDAARMREFAEKVKPAEYGRTGKERVS